MLTVLMKFAVLFTALYLLVVFGAVLIQRKLTYFPATERVDPAAAGLSGVEERVITTPDGAQVIAWYGKAKSGQPTLLYFHGNAGSLVTRSERIRKYLDRGRGVLMLSYRGYGGSTGLPSEQVNVADGKLAYELLANDGLRPEDIVIYGESLGTGVAVQVAAAKPAAGLILDAPYTSLVDVGAAAYPFLPVRWLMSDRYETLRHIRTLAMPLIIIHGELDAVIPVAMARAIHASYKGPKTLAIFPRAGHSDHHLHGSYEAINQWIDALGKGSVERRERLAN